MRLSYFIIILAMFTSFYGCKTRQSGEPVDTDTVTVADTGFTGIKKMMSGQYLVSEVTFKNGVRDGLTKTFYRSGRLQRTYWYRNGLRQDSSCWYYEEGQLFRTTPFKNDTMTGIQKQYYRTGEVKAKLGYRNGYRTDFFQEFTRDGKLVKGYPELVIKTEDKYTSNGTYRIILELTDPKTDVNYFKGELHNGAYDTTRIKKIRTVENRGFIDLKKTAAAKQPYVGVVAEILTGYGNRLLVFKKIDLPYNDLE